MQIARRNRPIAPTQLLSATALALLSGCGGSDAPSPGPTVVAIPPSQAAAVGYTTLTYGPTPVIVSSSSGQTGQAALLPWSFIGQASTGSAKANADGTLSLIGAASGLTPQLASAASGSAAGSVVGEAFGGGGYFEAVLSFDGWQGQSSNPNALDGGWPSFWGMSVEHLAQTGGDVVPGQATGFEDFIEMDFMEYNVQQLQGSEFVYSGSITNWYGVYGQTCTDAAGDKLYCNISNDYPSKLRQLGSSVDFSQFHAYGALWVPATATSDGYIEWYFDGQPVGDRVSWSELTTPIAIPPSPAYAIADQEHLAVILGTGSQYPMTVKSVSVWQKSGADNLIQ